MFAVIFRAKLATLDDEYSKTAARLRELAFELGCIDFSATTEGQEEIAVSYWPNEESIVAWKQQLEHRVAQGRGRDTWYREYKVEVARIERSYAWQR